MAQKVRKRPENELLAIKFVVANVVQNANLKLKPREREQKLKILDPPRRVKTWIFKSRTKRLSFFFPEREKKNWNFCEK